MSKTWVITAILSLVALFIVGCNANVVENGKPAGQTSTESQPESVEVAEENTIGEMIWS